MKKIVGCGVELTINDFDEPIIGAVIIKPDGAHLVITDRMKPAQIHAAMSEFMSGPKLTDKEFKQQLSKEIEEVQKSAQSGSKT